MGVGGHWLCVVGYNGVRTRREMAGRSEEIDARFVSDDEHKDGPGIQTAHASYRSTFSIRVERGMMAMPMGPLLLLLALGGGRGHKCWCNRVVESQTGESTSRAGASEKSPQSQSPTQSCCDSTQHTGSSFYLRS